MEKFNKEDFPLLFKSVSTVLGEEEAEKQLSIAYGSSGGEHWEDSRLLSIAFYWDGTIQGHDYWENIYNCKVGKHE